MSRRVAIIGCGKIGESLLAGLLSSAWRKPDDVIAWARDRLAHYKVPRRVVVVDELPRGGTGKVQKDRLRARFS